MCHHTEVQQMNTPCSQNTFLALNDHLSSMTCNTPTSATSHYHSDTTRNISANSLPQGILLSSCAQGYGQMDSLYNMYGL